MALMTPSDDEFAAFSTAWGEQHMEVVLTVLPAFEFVENSVRKRPEALGADEALGMEQFPIGIHDLGLGLEAPRRNGSRSCYPCS